MKKKILKSFFLITVLAITLLACFIKGILILVLSSDATTWLYVSKNDKNSFDNDHYDDAEAKHKGGNDVAEAQPKLTKA